MHLKSIILLLIVSSLTLFSETGDASWYGEKFHGKPTASGEPFDMYAYTAAHRTLPFGTMVTVTNLSNNKSIDVRITDRGPFKKSRIIDLSYQAAKEIGLVQVGIAKVDVEIKNKIASNENSNSNNDNPYLSDKQEASMKEYALKSKSTATEELAVQNKYLPSNVPIYSSHDELNAKVSDGVKVQIASFSSKTNANSFMDLEKENGYKMKIVDKYSPLKNLTLYKVVILCNSNSDAKNLINSKKYNGAYLLH